MSIIISDMGTLEKDGCISYQTNYSGSDSVATYHPLHQMKRPVLHGKHSSIREEVTML
jgi:hypothetical protein